MSESARPRSLGQAAEQAGFAADAQGPFGISPAWPALDATPT